MKQDNRRHKNQWKDQRRGAKDQTSKVIRLAAIILLALSQSTCDVKLRMNDRDRHSVIHDSTFQ
jgi:hypothetical protein